MKRMLGALAVVAWAAGTVLGTGAAHGPGPVRPPSGRTVTVKASSSAEIVIVHIVKGCHNWTNGKRLGDKADVSLHRGGRLRVLNQDVDLHKIVQLAGARVATGPRMTMNGGVTLRFPKPGTYRFKTVTSEMPGMPEMKTVGPDYVLRLAVTVR